jgi:hypothetical protein
MEFETVLGVAVALEHIAQLIEGLEVTWTMELVVVAHRKQGLVEVTCKIELLVDELIEDLEVTWTMELLTVFVAHKKQGFVEVTCAIELLDVGVTVTVSMEVVVERHKDGVADGELVQAPYLFSNGLIMILAEIREELSKQKSSPKLFANIFCSVYASPKALFTIFLY